MMRFWCIILQFVTYNSFQQKFQKFIRTMLIHRQLPKCIVKVFPTSITLAKCTTHLNRWKVKGKVKQEFINMGRCC